MRFKGTAILLLASTFWMHTLSLRQYRRDDPNTLAAMKFAQDLLDFFQFATDAKWVV
jgi:hypothetical protein